MSKSYYSDYTQHCIRFYIRYPKATFKTLSDKHNWDACKNAYEKLDKNKQEIIHYLFWERDTLPDNIYQISKQKNISQKVIWEILQDFEKMVATNRGLI